MKLKYINFRFLLLFLLILTCGQVLFANNGVELSIRFYDRRIYFLNSDNILVQVTVTNNSPHPYRFRLAEDRVFSIDFNVRTTTNRSVEAANSLLRRRTQSQQVFFRDIILETGESFSFVENLWDYSNFAQSGAYVVQAVLYPDLYQERQASMGQPIASTSQPLTSNFLSLSIRPRPLSEPGGIPLELHEETNALIVAERIPPDEVINFLLTARQRGQWERFFLYLDLEAMITRDPARARRWTAESAEGRAEMLRRYRQDLQNAEIEGDLYLIPSRFEMERTVYNNNSGTVTVMQYFDMGNFTQLKRYVWYLERKNDIWMVVDYSVTNLGTE